MHGSRCQAGTVTILDKAGRQLPQAEVARGIGRHLQGLALALVDFRRDPVTCTCDSHLEVATLQGVKVIEAAAVVLHKPSCS